MQLVPSFMNLKPTRHQFGRELWLFTSSARQPAAGSSGGSGVQQAAAVSAAASSVPLPNHQPCDADLAMLGGVLAEVLLERILLHDGQPGSAAGSALGAGARPGRRQQSLQDLYGYLQDLGSHWWVRRLHCTCRWCTCPLQPAHGAAVNHSRSAWRRC